MIWGHIILSVLTLTPEVQPVYHSNYYYLLSIEIVLVVKLHMNIWLELQFGNHLTNSLKLGYSH